MFTFGTHPRALVEGRPQELLLTNEERHDRLEALGLDLLIEYPFNETTSHILAEDFVRDILVRQLRARKIVVGTDFGFGYRRAGNVKLLCSLSKECGFELVVREKLKTKEGIDISSSYIKERLKRGEMEAVHALLGYPFFIRGIVRHGNRNGRTFGFPTINQFPEEKKLLPPNGVWHILPISASSPRSAANIPEELKPLSRIFRRTSTGRRRWWSCIPFCARRFLLDRRTT